MLHRQLPSVPGTSPAAVSPAHSRPELESSSPLHPAGLQLLWPTEYDSSNPVLSVPCSALPGLQLSLLPLAAQLPRKKTILRPAEALEDKMISGGRMELDGKVCGGGETDKWMDSYPREQWDNDMET